MKYPEHIAEFWRVRNIDSSITNNDFALYSYLCNCLNSVYWETDTITQRRELICGHLGINGKTLEESRNRLKQKGFIDFTTVTTTNKSGKKQGIKGSATVYKVLSEIAKTSPVSVPNSVPNGTLNEHETDTKETRNGTAFKYKKKGKMEIGPQDDFKDLTEEEIGQWEKFNTWFNEQNYKRLTKIDDQLTPRQALKLMDEFGKSAVADILNNIENKKGCETRYTSVYRTAQSWLKRDLQPK